MVATLSLKDMPDRAGVAAKEDKDNAIDAFQATGPKQWVEDLHHLDKNTLHLVNVFHALHEVGQVYYLTPDNILGGMFNRTPIRIIFSKVMEKGRPTESTVSSNLGD